MRRHLPLLCATLMAVAACGPSTDPQEDAAVDGAMDAATSPDARRDALARARVIDPTFTKARRSLRDRLVAQWTDTFGVLACIDGS